MRRLTNLARAERASNFNALSIKNVGSVLHCIGVPVILLQMRTATTEGALLCVRMKSSPRF